MDKNEKEKNMLYEWAKRDSSEYSLSRIDKDIESYFSHGERRVYIREYGFETLPELFSELDCLWKDEQIMEQIKKTVGVAALKNKPYLYEEKQTESVGKKKEDILPEFIYTF